MKSILKCNSPNCVIAFFSKSWAVALSKTENKISGIKATISESFAYEEKVVRKYEEKIEDILVLA